MPLSGVKSLKISVLFFLCISVFAEDFGIAVPDQLQGDERIYESGKELKSSDDAPDFLMGERGDYQVEVEEEENKLRNFAVPDLANHEKKELSEKEQILSTGNDVPFTYENRPTLIEFKNKEIFNKINNKGDSSFSFGYIMDTYEFKDSRNVFKNSYEDATGSKRGGAIHMAFDSYLTRGFFNLFWGGGFGVGFSEGKGRFASTSTEESNVIFKLYYAPVDLRLGLELVPSKYFKVGLAAGPSAMGLFQSRSDKAQNDDEKYRRQVSYGYFGSAKLQISVSSMSKSFAFKNFSQSDVTNMLINFEGRVQSYENFQDDISITGASFGLGVTFEYL